MFECDFIILYCFDVFVGFLFSETQRRKIVQFSSFFLYIQCLPGLQTGCNGLEFKLRKYSLFMF